MAESGAGRGFVGGERGCGAASGWRSKVYVIFKRWSSGERLFEGSSSCTRAEEDAQNLREERRYTWCAIRHQLLLPFKRSSHGC